ncbi:uncharacterized protein LOC124157238 isoform X1 [Ischnura elegans]|uniref:uncharacterized protein LOC124157238 isoform X1 n=1 Tax=Ischnura elegans TaxID=197161 RepID=UPI001ED880F3|nr:uncharacterized protein LOC124157238 isoform X1 [Ischnura elegans]
MLRKYAFPPSLLKWAIRIVVCKNSSRRFCDVVNRSTVAVNDSEVLDDFIESLMTKKMNKWKSINESRTKSDVKLPRIAHDPGKEALHDLTCTSVDSYVHENLTSSCLDTILNECLAKRICVSIETLMKASYVLAKAGNKTGIETAISLASDVCDDIKKGELLIYKAEAMWRSGESVQKSLELLHEVYRKQPGLRRLVRTSLKSLINGVLLCRGEATLIQVKNLVLELAQPPHEDAVPLSILWGQCILSEWFADQQVSVELANVFRDNPNFKKALESRVDAVVGQALTKHQVDAVYRVIETLLRLFMNEKAQTVLGNLFDYKYVIGDKRGCEAILDLCDTTDLDIGSTRRKQFENAPVVWLNRRNTLVPHKSLVKLYASPERLRVPKFKFKL